MTVDIALGTYGIWRGATSTTPELAQEMEALGFGAVWLGGSPPGDLAIPEALLDATERIVVATGIVNMWGAPPQEVAAAYHRVAERHPGRFLLGVGVSHPERVAEYRTPYATIVNYLDVLDAEGVPVAGRALAALGPRVLALAAERTLGAHPYLTVPEHTREARALIGPDALLAPEHKVVIDTDAERARAIGRGVVGSGYLTRRNYRANFLRMGFTEDDIAGEGSDSFIDAVVAHGDAGKVAARLAEHVDAGANHVCAQVLTAEPDGLVPALAELSDALKLR